MSNSSDTEREPRSSAESGVAKPAVPGQSWPLSLGPCPGQLRARPGPVRALPVPQYRRSAPRCAERNQRLHRCRARKSLDTSRDLSTRSHFASGNNICLFTVPRSGNGTRRQCYSRRALPRSAVLLSRFPTLGHLADTAAGRAGQPLPPG